MAKHAKERISITIGHTMTKPIEDVGDDPVLKRAALRAGRKMLDRRPYARLKADRKDGDECRPRYAMDPQTLGHEFLLADAFGTGSMEFVNQRLNDLIGALGPPMPSASVLNAAIAMVKGCSPRNEAEATIAVQAAVAHAAGMSAMESMKSADWAPQIETFGRLADRFMRTSASHLETLQKMQRGAQQKVVVEHVHVHEGGQAIVGSVTPTTASEGGGDGEIDKQPRAPGRSAPAALAEMRCEDPFGDALPSAGDAREEALSHARRP